MISIIGGGDHVFMVLADNGNDHDFMIAATGNDHKVYDCRQRGKDAAATMK